MIDLEPLLASLAADYTPGVATRVGALLGGMGERADALGASLVRHPDYAPIVSSAILTVMLLDAATMCEANGSADDTTAILRYVANLAANDAVLVAGAV